jgi:hypothetical protein
MRVLYEPEDVKFWTCLLSETSHQNQKGGGLRGFEGFRYQRGAGLGSFFRGLFRAALPVISNVGRTVGKQALSTGAAIMQDIVNGEDIEKVAKSRGREAAGQLLTKAANAIKQTGNGRFGEKSAIKRKNMHKRKKLASKRHKPSTIFDKFP